MGSLIIGWVPANDGTNKTAFYQPEPYQYVSTKTANCPAVEGTSNNAVETSDSSSKSLQLPTGWMLGLCLHY